MPIMARCELYMREAVYTKYRSVSQLCGKELAGSGRGGGGMAGTQV